MRVISPECLKRLRKCWFKHGMQQLSLHFVFVCVVSQQVLTSSKYTPMEVRRFATIVALCCTDLFTRDSSAQVWCFVFGITIIIPCDYRRSQSTQVFILFVRQNFFAVQVLGFHSKLQCAAVECLGSIDVNFKWNASSVDVCRGAIIAVWPSESKLIETSEQGRSDEGTVYWYIPPPKKAIV